MKHRFTLILTLLAAVAVGIFTGHGAAASCGAVGGLVVGVATSAFAANVMLIPWATGGWDQRLGIKGMVYNAQLTNFAHGIAPDFTSSLAELMAPQCIAPAAAGQFIAFDDDEAFRYIDTRRTLGGDMAMIDFPSTSPTFSCNPHALGIGIDSFELERVGAEGESQLREAKTRTLISRNALSREKRVFDAYAAGTTAESGLGVWTDADADPIDELNSVICDLATQTGQSKIDVVIALDALRQFGKHPKVRAAMPGADLINVTTAVVEKLLLFPVRLHVAMLPIILEKSGKGGSKVTIGASKIYAFITQANPSPYDPSAAKTFTTTKGQVKGVGTVEKPPFAEVVYTDWSEDIKMTGSKCVKRIDVTTGAIS